MNPAPVVARSNARPSFWQGVLVAVGLSIVGSVLYNGLDLVVSDSSRYQLLTTALSFAYVAWLLVRSNARSGRLTGLLLWSLAAVALWLLNFGAAAYLLGHLGLIWLFRSLLTYSSLLSGVIDLGLVAFSFAVIPVTAVQTGSPLITLWCFFLVQACSALIPVSWKPKSVESWKTGSVATSDDRFEQAYRSAEGALQRLTQQT